MADEVKTLQQIEAAQSVLKDALMIIDFQSRGRPAHDDVEGRFREAIYDVARRRLREMQQSLATAWDHAYKSSDHVARLDPAVFEHVRWFRSIGPSKVAEFARSLLHR